MNKLPMVLNQMGFKEMRKGQDAVVKHIMSGRDVLAILPTSMGKSFCYVAPTLCHDWHTIVFSPLVALMRDQVQSLQRKGIAAAQVSSNQSDAENVLAMKAWAQGELKFLFVSPERLENPMFKEVIALRMPDFVAMDEVHCLSDWGENFRPAYKKVGDFLREHPPKVVAAFSATAPEKVEDDVRRVLGLGKAKKILYYPRRENLILSSSKLEDEFDLVTHIRQTKGTTLVYCATIARLEALCGSLQAMLNEPVAYYHGQLPQATKRTTQDMFMEGKVRVMLATNAFGMGVDHGNIRHVIHRDIEGSIEAQAQAMGRAGRDQEDSWCHTFLSKDSIETQKFFFRMGHPDTKDIIGAYNFLKETADDMGRCYATYSQVASNLGLFPLAVGSIMNILTSDNVIRRSEDKDHTARIKYLGTEDLSDKFQQWKELVASAGFSTSDGAIEIDLEWLSEKLGYSSQATVRKYFKEWERDDLLIFTPPRRSPPIEIVGDINQVDFSRLAVKAKDAIDKLKDVIQYCHVPDKMKHAFIESKLLGET